MRYTMGGGDVDVKDACRRTRVRAYLYIRYTRRILARPREALRGLCEKSHSPPRPPQVRGTHRRNMPGHTLGTLARSAHTLGTRYQHARHTLDTHAGRRERHGAQIARHLLVYFRVPPKPANAVAQPAHELATLSPRGAPPARKLRELDKKRGFAVGNEGLGAPTHELLAVAGTQGELRGRGG